MFVHYGVGGFKYINYQKSQMFKCLKWVQCISWGAHNNGMYAFYGTKLEE